MIQFAALLALCSLSPAQEPAHVQVIQAGKRHRILLDGQALHSSARTLANARHVDLRPMFSGTSQGHEHGVLLWDEVSPKGREKPHYRVQLADGRWARTRVADERLHTLWARFDPLTQSPQERPSPLGVSGALAIVQYETQPLDSYRHRVEAAGGKVLRFLPGHGHIVHLPRASWEELQAMPFVRWVGAYDPRMRVEPALLERMQSGQALGTGRYLIQLTERGSASRKTTAARLVEAGAQMHASAEQGLMLNATLDEELLREVLAWDSVLYVDRWQPARTYMEKVRVDGGADYLESLTGFTGQGVAGEVLDSGLLTSHQDFQSNSPLLHNGNNADTWHGTSVAGIVFGDGQGSATARGMLPDGDHVFASLYNLNNRYTHTAQLLQPPYECVFQTNSWGWGYSSSYTNQTTTLDDVAFKNDLVICQAQGNSGNNQSEQLSWAKNVLSVGGIYHVNTQTLSDDFHNGVGGSHGPAPDGRIKPDLCYWYDSIRTTDHNGGYTNNFGGTSAATPETAGHVGLLHQMWHQDLFGTGPGGTTVFDSAPKATTAKAMMINTANQYSFTQGSDLRRVRQGWGRPSVQRLHDLRDEFFIVDETDVLQNLDTIVYQVSVAAGTPELRATLVYLDPAGTTSASQHRINDVSMRLISPSGVKYWGNQGMKTGMFTSTGGSSNKLDTVENVWLANPEAGNWTVKIFADEVNQDAHLETAAVDVDFALVVSGVTTSSCADPINYCSTSSNSAGVGAVMGFTGSASLAANDLTLTTSGLPASTFGVYLYGPTQDNQPAGNGTLCVAQPFGILGVVLAGTGGTSSLLLDMTSLPGGPVNTGDTLHFQLWYRDRPGGGSGNNLSDGLQATFCD
ncbi:MAG: peptidase S8 [Planctomycetes bacterium]|nr:peptidase S8 [Planctomycetota bacterium]